MCDNQSKFTLTNGKRVGSYISLWVLMCGFLGFLGIAPLPAAEEAPNSGVLVAPPQRLAVFLTLDGVISDNMTAAVRRTALELQSQALQEHKQAFLVLELSPGISEFHHVYSLIEFLTSDATINLTTICWVPRTVVGNNACVALACTEIVMHPEAQLGDIGRGNAVPASDQLVVKAIVAKRRNRRVTESLAVGLMDPAAVVMQMTIESSPGTVEKQVVTQPEATERRNSNAVIRDTKTIKDAGVPWKLTANQAQDWGVLVSQVASTRAELVEIYALPFDSLRERPISEGHLKAEYIRINGVIDPGLAAFLQRQIDRAVEGGAQLILFEIDSPGGFQFECDELAQTLAGLKERGVHAVAYIPEEASSGSAVVALGCDDIYLRPTARIGNIDLTPAPMPRRGRRRQPPPPPPQVDISATRKLLGELAEKKNRPVAIVQAMADPDLEVYQATHRTKGTVTFMSDAEIHAGGEDWIKGPLVEESKKGQRLTITGQRAQQLQIGQTPVESFDELKLLLGISAEQRLAPMERTWVDDFVFWLNKPPVMALLFFVGLVAIYQELHTMTGVFGLVSALCFGLYFWSKVLGGTAGTLEIVLFVLGVACLLLEIFVLPGFGIFGVTGIVLTLASIIMAAQTFGHLGPNMSDFDQTLQTLKIFGSAVLGVVICAIALAKFLPHIPLFNDMILQPPTPDSVAAPRLKPELVGKTAALVGQTGVAMTVLRPSGKAEIEGQLVDVMSEGVFIPEGASVEVIECRGKRIVVRQV